MLKRFDALYCPKMRYRVDTSELWTMAATAQESADGLADAAAALSRVVDVHTWCAHSDAAVVTGTAVAALEDHLSAAQACAAGLARQLASAANGYQDVDTLRAR